MLDEYMKKMSVGVFCGKMSYFYRISTGYCYSAYNSVDCSQPPPYFEELIVKLYDYIDNRQKNSVLGMEYIVDCEEVYSRLTYYDDWKSLVRIEKLNIEEYSCYEDVKKYCNWDRQVFCLGEDKPLLVFVEKNNTLRLADPWLLVDVGNETKNSKSTNFILEHRICSFFEPKKDFYSNAIKKRKKLQEIGEDIDLIKSNYHTVVEKLEQLTYLLKISFAAILVLLLIVLFLMLRG